MAHRTLVNGTSYEITSGRTLIHGTGYDIGGGRTLVNGTGYDISFGPKPYAMVYVNDVTQYKTVVFQLGNDPEPNRILENSYTDFVNKSYSRVQAHARPPWYGLVQEIYFKNEIFTTTMSNWFADSTILKTSLNNLNNLTLNGVTDMSEIFYNCSNLIGSPKCSNFVVNMAQAYGNCQRLSGSPVCGDNVVNMHRAYDRCFELTGSPVCGDNVIDMDFAYSSCKKLSGSPVCGNNVTSMVDTYYGCFNLTGSPVCGNNVTNMCYTYSSCFNLTGNGYLYSSSINNAQGCFLGKNNSTQLNIYFPINSTTNTTMHISDSKSLVGGPITWTTDAANNCSYNTQYNIYLYPVENVAAARELNGD